MTEAPELSVVIGLISGRKADLERCLEALSRPSSVRVELLVPYDEAVKEVAELAERFPDVRFLLAEGLDTHAARAGGSREHHDTLRTLGLRAATGEFVALTEDHAVVQGDWCADMVALLRAHPKVAGIGGAVECESESRLNHAVYYCDFGRYQNPLPEGPAEYVSDSNVAYRRAALEEIADAWADDYHETMVHWALVERGYELWLTPRSLVHQARHDLDLGEALKERYVWGRSFAGTRARGVGARRWVYAVLSFLLPVVLSLRVVRGALSRGRHRGRLFAALPYIVLLHVVWAFGELVGYVTNDPGSGA